MTLKTINSKSFTKENSKGINKPNEDFFIADDNLNIYIVADGVSRDKINGIYPNPSPSQAIAKLFVDSTHKYIADNIQQEKKYTTLLFKAMQYANIIIKDKNSTLINDFLPGTVGITALVKNNILYYSYIGDCYGMVISNNEKLIITKCQTEQITIHKKEFTSNEIRNVICNNPKHPYSYGVLNGDERALKFIETGKIDMNNISCIYLYSDGLDNAMNELSVYNLKTMKLNDIVNYDNEEDDKTIISINCFE